jgi:hypothetical protein
MEADAGASRSLELFADGRLTGKKERGWETALTTELERAEVLEPTTFWHLRHSFQPKSETIEVLEADVAIAHALD